MPYKYVMVLLLSSYNDFLDLYCDQFVSLAHQRNQKKNNCVSEK